MGEVELHLVVRGHTKLFAVEFDNFKKDLKKEKKSDPLKKYMREQLEGEPIEGGKQLWMTEEWSTRTGLSADATKIGSRFTRIDSNFMSVEDGHVSVVACKPSRPSLMQIHS